MWSTKAVFAVPNRDHQLLFGKPDAAPAVIFNRISITKNHFPNRISVRKSTERIAPVIQPRAVRQRGAVQSSICKYKIEHL